MVFKKQSPLTGTRVSALDLIECECLCVSWVLGIVMRSSIPEILDLISQIGIGILLDIITRGFEFLCPRICQVSGF